MRSFDLAVELRRSRLDIGMADPLVLDMPVEFGLEFMAIVSPDFLNAERKLVDDMVDEVDGVGLGVTVVDLESPNARGVINRGVLEPPYGLPRFALEGEEFDIHLDMVARHLLVVAPGMNLPDARAARQSV